MLPGSLAALETAQLGPAAFHYQTGAWHAQPHLWVAKGTRVLKTALASGSKNIYTGRACELLSEMFTWTRKSEPDPHPCFTLIS